MPTTDYILRIKGRADERITKEEALECFKILEKRESSVTLSYGGKMKGFFSKNDIRLEKPEGDKTGHDQYADERSQRFLALKEKREKWTDEKIASMTPGELDRFKQMAIARYGEWYSRSRLTFNPTGFDRFLAGYIRILIRWQKGYRDEDNDYSQPHFTQWHKMVERPDLLPA